MSIYRKFIVECEHCSNWEFGGSTLETTIKRLEKYGWVFDGNYSCCEECSIKIKSGLLSKDQKKIGS